jgi:DtxR family transcriptional regulator, Mn-dependent transcriptional regulator
MIALVTRLRNTLLGTRPWKESCEAGPPVPRPDACPTMDCHSVRLADMPRGGEGAVTCLEEPWTADAAKLASLGILPGVRVRLVQRYPAYILQLGRAQVAIDGNLASRVRVRLAS